MTVLLVGLALFPSVAQDVVLAVVDGLTAYSCASR